MLVKPVVAIDGAHLSPEGTGTIFLLIATDGNNELVPLAAYIAKSETAEAWTVFLQWCVCALHAAAEQCDNEHHVRSLEGD